MHPETTVASMAAQQGGIITRDQAIKAGLSDEQIVYRLRSGRWSRYSHGAYRVLTLDGQDDLLRAAAAVLPNAVVSHRSAALLHGIEGLSEGPATVLVHTKTTHTFPGVQVIRCHDLDESHVQIVDGLRTTTPPRTIVDLAAVLPMGRLASALDDCLAQSLARIDAIAAVLEQVARRGKPGVTKLRQLLDERDGDDYSGSLLEARGNALLEQEGLPRFVSQYPIPWSPRQRFDVAFPDHNLAIEWDSRRWHGQLGAFDEDRKRDREAVLHGWRLLRFTWADVMHRPGVVSNTIKAILLGP